MSERKPYEKPAIAFEKHLEAMAADCDPTGLGENNVYLGDNNCKGSGPCTITFS